MNQESARTTTTEAAGHSVVPKAPTFESLPLRKTRNRRGGDDLVELSVVVEVVTPILGGGYRTRELDDVNIIRPATIRGHLRFWWRALYGSKCETARALYEMESNLWGCAADEKDGGRSAVDVRVSWLRITDEDKTPFHPQRTEGAYALWPAKDQEAREGRAYVPTAPRRSPGTQFRLTLFGPKEAAGVSDAA
jgi:CRISPR-associated protein Cmr1